MAAGPACRDRTASLLRGAMDRVPAGLHGPGAERGLSSARRGLCVVLRQAHSDQSSADVRRFSRVYTLAHVHCPAPNQRPIQDGLGCERHLHALDLLEMGIGTQSSDLSRDLSRVLPLAPDRASDGWDARLSGLADVPPRMADGIFR